MNTIVEAIVRRLYRRYLTRPARSALKAYFELLRAPEEPATVAPPRVHRGVVLAPHMDDGVFGCGGTLAMVAAQGAEIAAIFVTDGRKGYFRARDATARSREEVRRIEKELAVARQEEARRADKILGLSEPMFLDLPDRAFEIDASAVGRLRELLVGLRPDAIWLPFITDPHRDHWLTNTLTIAALRGHLASRDLVCWGYEVGTPIPANTAVDITAVMDCKRDAMGEFKSQLSYCSYDSAIAALNAYRSLFTSFGRGFAEAFYVAPFDVYARLYDLAAHERAQPRTRRRPRRAA